MQPVRSPGVFQHQQGLASGGSCGRAGNFLLMVELRSRIMRFRDILDLSPCKASTPMNEVSLISDFLFRKKNHREHLRFV